MPRRRDPEEALPVGANRVISARRRQELFAKTADFPANRREERLPGGTEFLALRSDGGSSPATEGTRLARVFGGIPMDVVFQSGLIRIGVRRGLIGHEIWSREAFACF
ncbi:hypothetical protein L345_07913, partial [Ophiophagus hannah]